MNIYRSAPGLGTLVHDTNGCIAAFGGYRSLLERELAKEKPNLDDVRNFVSGVKAVNERLVGVIDSYYKLLKDCYESGELTYTPKSDGKAK